VVAAAQCFGSEGYVHDRVGVGSLLLLLLLLLLLESFCFPTQQQFFSTAAAAEGVNT